MAQKLQNTYGIVQTLLSRVVAWELFRHSTYFNSKQNYFIINKQRKLVLLWAFTEYCLFHFRYTVPQTRHT